MFGTRRTLKSIALLLLAFSLSGMTSAHDAKRWLADVDEITMPSSDEFTYGERRLTWNLWSSFMFDILGSWCADPEGHCRPICGPPPPYCHDENHKDYNPGHPHCQICTANADSVEGTEEETDTAGDETTANGNQGTGASMMTNWWVFVVGAAVVGMMVAGVIMKKRRNTGEDMESGHSLSGAVNMRAAALLGDGAVVGAGAAALPKFLNVPSMRRVPSGIEVNEDGGILEQSPSNYYEMEGAVDASQLPDGVEISQTGSLAPYMV